MTHFEIDHRKFEHLPQSRQLSTTFTSTIEEVLETLYTADIDITWSYSVIETVVNHIFGNTFQHQNGTNQRQHIHKNNIQKYQHKNTSQQY